MKRTNPVIIGTAVVSVAALAVQAQTTWFVDDDNCPGPGTGSQLDPFCNLQDALSAASAGDEIWVLEGTYRPTGPGGSRTATFALVEGVELYGGFDGTETSVEQRDVEANPTVLSGDLHGNDRLVACSADLPDCAAAGGRCFDGSCILKEQIGENSHTVVSADGVSASTVLDGFIITGGTANGSSTGLRDGDGGGMYIKFLEVGQEIVASEPMVRNCRFEWNSCTGWGAGIYTKAHLTEPDGATITNTTFHRNTNYTATSLPLGGAICTVDSDTTITDCTFRENVAVADSYYGFGGAIGTQNVGFGVPVFPAPRLTCCRFINNWSDGFGGAMYDSHNSPLFVSCMFIGNRSAVGGGYVNVGGIPTVINSIFIGNTATEPSAQFENVGGGLAMPGSDQAQEATIVNSVFVGNVAGASGGGVYWKPLGEPTAVRRIVNTILWDNTANGVPNQIGIDSPPGCEPRVTFSNIEGGFVGTGNISLDPQFIDVDGDDNIAGTADDNLRLSPGSPCIDAGDNTAAGCIDTDYDGGPRRMDDPDTYPDTGQGGPPLVDMGPFEFVPEDCNDNGVPDDQDIANETSPDGNENGIPDECEVYQDCNGDGREDACELNQGLSPDCQPNGIPDECDISSGTSPDVNGNTIPDECDPPCTGDPDCDDGEYCNGPEICVDTTCQPGPEPCVGRVCDEINELCLGCVTDIGCDDGDVCTQDTCTDGDCTNTARLYCDVNNDGAINVFDLFCVLDGFAGGSPGCSLVNIDIDPCTRNDTINIFDLFAVLNAFGGDDPCCGGSP